MKITVKRIKDDARIDGKAFLSLVAPIIGITPPIPSKRKN
jgi:hypothetical protein